MSVSLDDLAIIRSLQDNTPFTCVSSQQTITYSQVSSFVYCPILAAKKVPTDSPHEKLVLDFLRLVAKAYFDPENPVSIRWVVDEWDRRWQDLVRQYGKNTGGYGTVQMQASAGIQKIMMLHGWITKNLDRNDVALVAFPMSAIMTDDIKLVGDVDVVLKTGEFMTIMLQPNRTAHPYSSKWLWDAMMWDEGPRPVAANGRGFVLEVGNKTKITRKDPVLTPALKANYTYFLKAIKETISMEVIPGKFLLKTCPECQYCGGKHYALAKEIRAQERNNPG